MKFVFNNRVSAKLFYLLTVPVIFMVLAVSSAYAQKLSDYHTLNIDPAMKKKMGSEALKSIEQFFKSAELAIETENLADLMSLYSDNYKNESHTKKSAGRIWKRIFQTFDNMASIHNMRMETYSPESKVIIIRCSGLLMGKPQGESELITIDSWTNEDHILTRASKEGSWKLIGATGGKDRQRFWFDKPMHPLF